MNSGAANLAAAQMLSLTFAQRMWPDFENEYDQLGPVEFSKRVTDFGDWLGRQRNLSTADKAAAYARYVFLQDRLNFWMSYSAKPANADNNLVSAASFLFQGAINAGVVTDVKHLPLSYVRAGLVGMQYEGPQLRIGRRPGVDTEELVRPGISRRWPEDLILGGVVSNEDVGIGWGKGTQNQGGPWEEHITDQPRVGQPLPSGAKTFDAFDKPSGKATSAKTLDTTAYGYARDPKRIYTKLASYIDQMANYSKPRQQGDLDPAVIKQRVLELAVPEYTSDQQRAQLNAAMDYGRKHGVVVMITVVADDPLVVAPAPRQALPRIGVQVSSPTHAVATNSANAAAQDAERRRHRR